MYGEHKGNRIDVEFIVGLFLCKVSYRELSVRIKIFISKIISSYVWNNHVQRNGVKLILKCAGDASAS